MSTPSGAFDRVVFARPWPGLDVITVLDVALRR
jgi:hypothetical protein